MVNRGSEEFDEEQWYPRLPDGYEGQDMFEQGSPGFSPGYGMPGYPMGQGGYPRGKGTKFKDTHIEPRNDWISIGARNDLVFHQGKEGSLDFHRGKEDLDIHHLEDRRLGHRDLHLDIHQDNNKVPQPPRSAPPSTTPDIS